MGKVRISRRRQGGRAQNISPAFVIADTPKALEEAS